MPTALARLFRSGMRDADARLERALAPRPSIAADRYLASSLTIRSIDGLLQRWSAVLAGSFARRTLLAPLGLAHDATWRQRYEALGWLLVVAALTHVALTVAEGPRPGWYWLVIPSMAIGFGVLLLTAANSAPRS